MRHKTTEDLVITQIENGIRSIKLGTKKPGQVELDKWFDKLENINKSMCDELIMKYHNIVRDYKSKEYNYGNR
jgi:hypothetical protein